MIVCVVSCEVVWFRKMFGALFDDVLESTLILYKDCQRTCFFIEGRSAL